MIKRDPSYLDSLGFNIEAFDVDGVQGHVFYGVRIAATGGRIDPVIERQIRRFDQRRSWRSQTVQKSCKTSTT